MMQPQVNQQQLLQLLGLILIYFNSFSCLFLLLRSSGNSCSNNWGSRSCRCKTSWEHSSSELGSLNVISQLFQDTEAADASAAVAAAVATRKRG